LLADVRRGRRQGDALIGGAGEELAGPVAAALQVLAKREQATHECGAAGLEQERTGLGMDGRVRGMRQHEEGEHRRPGDAQAPSRDRPHPSVIHGATDRNGCECS
jgi:hypothetical protein